MEEKWFIILRDTMGIAGNLAEIIGLLFVVTQFRRTSRGRPSIKRRSYE